MHPVVYHGIAGKVLIRLGRLRNRFSRFIPGLRSFSSRAGTQKDYRLFLREKLRRLLGEPPGQLAEALDAASRRQILDDAEAALRHQFRYLGSETHASDTIDWHTDFKNHYTWKRGAFYLDYHYGRGGNDVKLPWELSRCHHLLWCGEAYLLTGEERFSEEAVHEILDWIEENPYRRSINWTCAMETSIRAINWLYALNMIEGSPALTGEAARKIYFSLFLHGCSIADNLEKTFPYSNNHYAADLAGMLFLGELFSHSPEGKTWLKFAIPDFWDEIRRQVLPSGVHYEKSVSYHRLMTELFVYPFLMLRRTDVTLPLDIAPRLHSMIAYIETCRKPNGLSPLIGDNDDGRLLPFVRYDLRDHSYLPALKQILGGNLEFANNEIGGAEAFFLAGKIPQRGKGTPFRAESKVFPDAGMAVIHAGASYLFINSGGICKCQSPAISRAGTHTHADLLSFELNLKGRDIFVDPGSYCYTSSASERDRFRSTAAHNTVEVDGNNQFVFTDSFSGRNFPTPEPIAFGNLADQVVCTAAYRGFKSGLRHWRVFSFRRDGTCLVLADTLSAEGDHAWQAFFHLAPGVNASLEEGGVRIVGKEVQAQLVWETSCEVKAAIQDDRFSPSYGIEYPSETIVLSGHFCNRLELNSKIRLLDSWNR